MPSWCSFAEGGPNGENSRLTDCKLYLLCRDAFLQILDKYTNLGIYLVSAQEGPDVEKGD